MRHIPPASVPWMAASGWINGGGAGRRHENDMVNTVTGAVGGQTRPSRIDANDPDDRIDPGLNTEYKSEVGHHMP